jgi:hypothetical protein
VHTPFFQKAGKYWCPGFGAAIYFSGYGTLVQPEQPSSMKYDQPPILKYFYPTPILLLYISLIIL